MLEFDSENRDSLTIAEQKLLDKKTVMHKMEVFKNSRCHFFYVTAQESYKKCLAQFQDLSAIVENGERLHDDNI